MKHVYFVAVWLLVLASLVQCGREPAPNPVVPITPPPIVAPKASAVQIGTPAKEGQVYSWSPADGLSDSQVAQPLASPKKTTKYEVTASSKCGAATSYVTIHVWKTNDQGELVEVLE